MLNISFFIAAFSSISWFVFSLRFIDMSAISGTAGGDMLYRAIIISLFPVAVIWGIFAAVKSFYAERHTANGIYFLLEQLKKNTENTNSLSCALIAAEKEIKSGFALHEFDILISDVNEVLSDIIKRSNSISSAQIEHLWSRTAGGERWLIAKTFIEINAFQPGFAEHLLQKAQKDNLLRGSILEFHSRFKSLRQLLELHDSQKLFFNMVEYGALGKSFHLLAPLAETLYNETAAPTPPPFSAPLSPTSRKKGFSSPEENSGPFPSFLSQPQKKAPSQPLQPKEKTISAPNMGNSLRATRDGLVAPVSGSIQTEEPAAPVISGFSNTQTALRSFKNEPQLKAPAPSAKPTSSQQKKVISLAELEEEINASPENSYDEYAYPFGAWLDEKKPK